MYAQSNWSLGGKIGINISSAGIDDNEADVRSKVGYNIGFVADYNFSPQIFLRTGLEFTTKGATLKSNSSYWQFCDTPGGHLYTKSKYMLNYLQLPVMLGYRLPINQQINLTANAGMYVGYRIYGSQKRTSYITTSGSEIDRDLVMDKFDCGFIAGIGSEYGKYSLAINYEGGLSNTMAGKLDGGDASWKNRNWSISLGYKF